MDETSNKLVLNSVELKNFRCFQEKKISFQYPITCIEGNNGTGKTSLLEALYFAGNLRSFKTVHSKELIHTQTDGFFLKLNVSDTITNDMPKVLKIGYTAEKKALKLDNVLVTSFAELNQYYQVLATTEDDVSIIQGSPLERRTFIDHGLMLTMPTVAPLFKQFRRILAQRNQLLMQRMLHDKTLYMVLTEQLLNATQVLQQYRITLLDELHKIITPWVKELWGNSTDFSAEYSTRYKIICSATAEQFLSSHPQLIHLETRYGRSLFGIHVDDISFMLQGMPARTFSSRGQQKSLIMLLKIALLHYLLKLKNTPTLFLLDDFLTDFDTQRLHYCMQLLQNLPVQLIMTFPSGAPIKSSLSLGNSKELLDIISI